MDREKIRVLAQKTAESAYLTELIGGIIEGIAKDGEKKLSDHNSWNIDTINPDEETQIPKDIVNFLLKKRNLVIYAQMVREEVVIKLRNSDKLDIKEIVQYSAFFNMKNLRNVECNCVNLVRLAIAVAVDDCDNVGNISEQCPEFIEELFMALKVTSCSDDLIFLKAIAKVCNLFQM